MLRYFISKYRWTYLLLTSYVVLQSYFLFSIDPRYSFLLLFALVPGICYLSIVRYSDVGAKEPRGVIALHILLGIIVIYPAILIEQFGVFLLLFLGFEPDTSFDLASIGFWFFFAVVVVAPVEEGLKLMFSLLGNKFHEENDEATDSIVYTVAVATGFALFENYRYVFNSLGQLSLSGSFLLAVARSFTAIPLHLGMGLIMGYYLAGVYHPDKLGIAEEQKRSLKLKAFLVPTVLHGLYDVLVFFNRNFYLQVFFATSFVIVVSWVFWRRVHRLRTEGQYTFFSSKIRVS